MRISIIHHPVITELCSGEYAAKWGLTDFYPEAEDKLKELIESGENFCTKWGCKKEIRYADIERTDTECVVTVTSHMDDLDDEGDLIYDAVWETMHIEPELPEAFIQDVYETAMDMDLDDCTSLEQHLPRTATYEDICSAIEELENQTEKYNTQMFEVLCGIVEELYRYIDSYKKED